MWKPLKQPATLEGLDKSNAARHPLLLVVDDDADILGLVTDYFVDTGFNVIAAGCGPDAIGVIRSETNVDLVFSDINMPGAIDGQGVAAWLSVHRPDLPIILTSGGSCATLHGERQRFVAKPYLLCDVEREIQQLLAAP